jgi:ketosteroid isomerase-like protein
MAWSRAGSAPNSSWVSSDAEFRAGPKPYRGLLGTVAKLEPLSMGPREPCGRRALVRGPQWSLGLRSWSGRIGVMPDSRVTVAQNFFQKFFRGDVPAACELLDPQVVAVVPGTHARSGVFQGVQAVAAHLSTFLQLTEDPIDVLEWEDWMAGVDNVAGLAKIHLQREGQQHDFRVIFLVSVTDDGRKRITRIESFFSDQAAFDRFFSVEP